MLRLVILVLGLAAGIWFVMRYAERVRRDPSTSLVYDMKEANEAHFAAATDEARARSSSPAPTRSSSPCSAPPSR